MVRICDVRVVIFILSLLLIGIQQTFAQVQVTEEWVARYNGPANSFDVARAITTDSSGNIYVTGWSYGSKTGRDYATVSYDSSGNERWVARYKSPGDNDDYALAIDTDSSGNIYVTGGSAGEYATVSYDSSGNERWVARYNGPANLGGSALAISIDSYGNIYVTGTISTGIHVYDTDYATVSYDSLGNQRWATIYSGPVHGNVARAITIDSSGNVYVTGHIYGSEGNIITYEDYATVSYDSSGNERWVARYNGPANSIDVATAITTNMAGNIYVTGASNGGLPGYPGIGTGGDYATVSYDSSGNERWVARYNGPANSTDGAMAIDTDSSGNIYVTGYSYGIRTNEDYATVSYDSSGNERWVARYNGPANSTDGAMAIDTDSSGNIYVTGYSYGIGSEHDYATVSYDSSGNERWVARYNGPANLFDHANDITADSSGNVYVTGFSFDSDTYDDYTTIKYSQITKLPLGGSVAGTSAPGSFKVFVPSRYGGEFTVSVVDSITGFPTGNVELFYPDFNTPIPSTEDIDLMPSRFKYEVPQDKYGWYYVKVTGSTNYMVSDTFIEKGEVLPERKPWNISTWWPFSDVYDTGDSLTPDDDASTISEIETLDDSIYPKYDVACGLYSNDSATYWETAKSVLADGHYIYNGEDRETHAEFDWKYDWNGTNGIENPGPYDFFSNTPGEGLFYSDGDLNDTYNSTWWGHCNGWARASIIFQEPSFSQLRNGFTPQDVKGLLTEIGMKETREDAVYQYQEPDEGAWAKEIHDFLKKFIKDNKMTIWGDLKSTERIKDKVDEVWNHPIWYYEASMKERPSQEGEIPNERLVDVTLTLKAADDLGGNVREDSPETGRPWKYHLMYDTYGEIDKSGSGWDTFAVDDPNIKYYIPFLKHPKSVSDVFIGQSNPYVTEDRIKTNVVYGEIRRSEW